MQRCALPIDEPAAAFFLPSLALAPLASFSVFGLLADGFAASFFGSFFGAAKSSSSEASEASEASDPSDTPSLSLSPSSSSAAGPGPHTSSSSSSPPASEPAALLSASAVAAAARFARGGIVRDVRVQRRAEGARRGERHRRGGGGARWAREARERDSRPRVTWRTSRREQRDRTACEPANGFELHRRQADPPTRASPCMMSSLSLSLSAWAGAAMSAGRPPRPRRAPTRPQFSIAVSAWVHGLGAWAPRRIIGLPQYR